MKYFLFCLGACTALLAQPTYRLQHAGFVPSGGLVSSPSHQTLMRMGGNELGVLHAQHWNDDPNTMVQRQVGPVPDQYQLEQNYPNPFNQSTRFLYRLAESGWVRIVVYSTLGKQVTVLADGFQQAGTYLVRYHGCDAHGSPLPSGVYFIRMITAKYDRAIKSAIIR